MAAPHVAGAFAALRSALPCDFNDPTLPDGWVNFYRRDDVTATTYFYLDRAAGTGQALPPVAARVAGLE